MDLAIFSAVHGYCNGQCTVDSMELEEQACLGTLFLQLVYSVCSLGFRVYTHVTSVSILQFYLRKQFYEPCKLTHWMPSGGPEKMDYSGQCNDGYFRLSWQGRLECRLDGIKKMNAREAVLKSGERIPCDMLVVASGCKYNLDPPFLRELGIGVLLFLLYSCLIALGFCMWVFICIVTQSK